MDEQLSRAVALFNEQQYARFEDTIEELAGRTRAVSERQFYALLDNLAEALLQLSDADFRDAQEMVADVLRKLDEFVPRYRGLNTEALREDLRGLLVELRGLTSGERSEVPSRLPRLRVLPE